MIRRPTNSRQGGFTLIESIISTALFAFVITSVLGVYIAVLQLDGKTRAQRAVANDARFIMDFFAKEIRNGRIAYEDYPDQFTCKNECGGTSPNLSDLYLVNQNNERVRVYYWDRSVEDLERKNFCHPTNSVCDLFITKGNSPGQVNPCTGDVLAPGTSQLNSCNVRVNKFSVITIPIADPFNDTTYNVQPNVQVILELVADYGTRNSVRMHVQSTFSTLYYPSRP